jgi:hypothetical protein
MWAATINRELAWLWFSKADDYRVIYESEPFATIRLAALTGSSRSWSKR